MVNGGFETGDLTGWVGTPYAAVSVSVQGDPAPEGEYAAFLPTAYNPVPFWDYQLEAFLGLPVGELDSLGLGDAVSGEAIMQDVHVSAGDVLSFQYNIISVPGRGNDFTFVAIGNDVRVFGASLDADIPVPGGLWQTGFASVEYVLETEGVVQLAFGVVDLAPAGYPTNLRIDQVAIVPEPVTLVMLGVGLLTMASLRAIRRARATT